MLSEANRVLADDGSLFVYTHVRKNGPLAMGVRIVNRFADGLDKIGVLDLKTERLRKSDHLNPIADHDELRSVAAAAGFDVERITYYTPIFGAFVENVLMRMGERLLARRQAQGGQAGADVKAARAEAKSRLRRRGPLYWATRAATGVMYLDVLLWGRFKSGPFFARLRKRARQSH
jgi:hypothetical protein